MEPFDIGRSRLDNGDFDSAIRHFTEAIRLAPTDPTVYLYRGCSYGNKGEFDEAIADFTKGIALNPSDAFAYFARGYAYDRAGKIGEAIMISRRRSGSILKRRVHT